jgi:transposase
MRRRSPARTGIYNNRNVVERLWARLKEWRAVATRYEKTALILHGRALPRRGNRLGSGANRP